MLNKILSTKPISVVSIKTTNSDAKNWDKSIRDNKFWQDTCYPKYAFQLLQQSWQEIPSKPSAYQPT